MNTNDIVYKVAARAKELAGKPIDALRIDVASQEAHSYNAMMEEATGKTRGELIEEILLDEFIEEHPKEVACE